MKINNIKEKIIKLKNNQNYHLVFDKKGDYLVYFENYSGELKIELSQQEVNVNIYGLYIGKNNDKFKIKTIQHHKAPNSKSNLLIKGVFYDKSYFVYDGLIRIEKNAQKSHAYQKNQNLLLSDKTFVQSEPNLEILANDVFCTHGSTTGHLNSEELFYLYSRGIDKKNAEKLLVNGFIKEVKQIKDIFKKI
ncbi:MAG: SufD family Fe-S cluster assembly protein [Patescibacteria group bacterium]|nr:SufD family Fe-S cluster assembly protein [Patescibacteria group bacterium]